MRRLAAALAAAAAWSSLALSSAPSPAPERRTLRLRYKPADREVGRYQYVPVTIDAGTTRLEIAYRYDKVGGANAVDLGLLEPGPLALGTPARRGWSGGARDRVVVADTEATPGYWPGPLPAGEWHVALGRLLVIGGEEVTTPGGHANVWGLRGWRSEIDFRVPPGPGSIDRASVRVRADELSAPAILAAIRADRVVVMADARTPPPVLTVRAGAATAAVGDTLRVRPGDALEVEVTATDPAFTGARAHLVGDGEAAGDAPLSPAAPGRFRRTATANGTLRAEVRASDGSLLALINPVYVATEDRAPARSSNRLK